MSANLWVTLFLSVFLMPFIRYHLLSNWLGEADLIGLLLVAFASVGVMGLVLIRFMPKKIITLLSATFFLPFIKFLLFSLFLNFSLNNR